MRRSDLRRSFTSRLVMARVDLRTVAQLLRHKALRMVMRYLHLSQSHELAAVERLCETGRRKPKNELTPEVTPAQIMGLESVA